MKSTNDWETCGSCALTNFVDNIWTRTDGRDSLGEDTKARLAQVQLARSAHPLVPEPVLSEDATVNSLASLGGNLLDVMSSLAHPSYSRRA